MNTKDYTAEYRLTHWARIMRERKESGLSVRAYCEQAGFHENTYFYWQKRLRETACEEYERIQHNTASLTPVFAEVKMPGRFAVPSVQYDQLSDICIEATGVRISANREYPVSQLTELLNTVMRSCC